MGGGIAMNFANVGIPVMIVEQKQDALDRGLATIRNNYERSRSAASRKADREAHGLITGSLAIDDAART